MFYNNYNQHTTTSDGERRWSYNNWEIKKSGQKGWKQLQVEFINVQNQGKKQENETKVQNQIGSNAYVTKILGQESNQ